MADTVKTHHDGMRYATPRGRRQAWAFFQKTYTDALLALQRAILFANAARHV
jgi:hypothetical protein